MMSRFIIKFINFNHLCPIFLDRIKKQVEKLIFGIKREMSQKIDIFDSI